MSELSDEEAERAARLLNTLPEDELNLLALDHKYDKEWYEQQLQAAQRIDEYFREVGEVMNMCGRHDVERAVDQRRTELTQLMNIFENAIEDLDDNYSTTRPTV